MDNKIHSVRQTHGGYGIGTCFFFGSYSEVFFLATWSKFFFFSSQATAGQDHMVVGRLEFCLFNK